MVNTQQALSGNPNISRIVEALIIGAFVSAASLFVLVPVIETKLQAVQTSLTKMESRFDSFERDARNAREEAMSGNAALRERLIRLELNQQRLEDEVRASHRAQMPPPTPPR